MIKIVLTWILYKLWLVYLNRYAVSQMLYTWIGWINKVSAPHMYTMKDQETPVVQTNRHGLYEKGYNQTSMKFKHYSVSMNQFNVYLPVHVHIYTDSFRIQFPINITCTTALYIINHRTSSRFVLFHNRFEGHIAWGGINSKLSRYKGARISIYWECLKQTTFVRYLVYWKIHIKRICTNFLNSYFGILYINEWNVSINKETDRWLLKRHAHGADWLKEANVCYSLRRKIVKVKRQWSGTDTIEFHILSLTLNGKGTPTIKTALK